MPLDCPKTRLLFRIIFIVLPLVFLFWLTSRYFAFSGHLNATYDFSEESPFISILWPPKRTSEILHDEFGDAYQEIRVDPVTFSVRLSRPTFRHVVVQVRYEKDPSLPFQIGVQRVDEEWKFQLKELATIGQEGNWTIGRAGFDLNSLYIKEKTVRFLLSSPYMDQTGKVIRISQIDVDFEKDPATVKNFWQRAKGFVSK